MWRTYILKTRQKDKRTTCFYRFVVKNLNLQILKLICKSWKKKIKIDKDGKNIADVSACSQQSQDSLVQQLAVQYPTIISSLLSKLGSKAPPPMLHLDFVHLLEDLPNSPSSLTSPTSTPTLSDPNLKERWSRLSAWISETQQLRTRDDVEVKSPTQTVPAVQQGIGDARTDSSQPRRAVKPLNLHRKYRSLLQKRQTAVASGKSKFHSSF